MNLQPLRASQGFMCPFLKQCCHHSESRMLFASALCSLIGQSMKLSWASKIRWWWDMLGKATSGHMDEVPAPKCLQLNIYLCSKLLLNPIYYMGADETVQDKVSQYAVVIFFWLLLLNIYMPKAVFWLCICKKGQIPQHCILVDHSDVSLPWPFHSICCFLSLLYTWWMPGLCYCKWPLHKGGLCHVHAERETGHQSSTGKINVRCWAAL